jgi:phospholipid-translocating ATPase
LGTFWKEIVFYLVQAQYQRYNGYTGTSLYEPASLAVFNTLFTSLPVILLGIFEQDLRAETLLAVPELYSYGQKNLGFNFRKYLIWMFMSTAEAVLIYYAIYGIYSSALFTADTTLFAMGSLAFTICVVFINIKMLVLELRNQTIISFLGLFISVSGWFTWNIFLSAIYAQLPGPYIVRGSFLKNFGRNPTWWVTGIVTLTAVIVFELVVASVRRVFWPRDQDLMQELEKDAGIMEVMREHAAERGEAGEAAGLAAQDTWRGESLTPKPADAVSIETSMSAASAEVTAWGWNRSGSGASATVPANRRGSKHLAVEDYMPPPFTPPAEDRENPMDRPSVGPSGKAVGEQQRSNSWLAEMSGANGQEQANAYFTQSPVELRLPSIEERRRQ